jgi:hypothetical protein
MRATDLTKVTDTEEVAGSRSGGTRHGRGYDCDACGKAFNGEPGGAGLFIWTRGDEVRYEEPPLCVACAAEITVGALLKWEAEDEEEG